ncbi:hypothetical protein Moror_5579 [Moniliophthora roreri MCA 2997]|uniref:Uncharacterized protein n=1 Tax=Moniliophthora roreri (strain MCA 2997) TaxID=1381753 RepID=V2X2X7_MONRO|nr:hypothetical protein Moror_5579 [Moniliophthora roreri MCA 2997]
MTPILLFTANLAHLAIDIIASLIKDGAWRQNGQEQGLDHDMGNQEMWYQTCEYVVSFSHVKKGMFIDVCKRSTAAAGDSSGYTSFLALNLGLASIP